MLTIGYWDIRGLAAPMRMMCEYAGVEYENKMYSDFGVWMGDKTELKKLDPLINLPFVKDGDQVISQSNACQLFLAKKLAIGIKNLSDFEECTMFSYLCEVLDVRNNIIDLVYPFRTVCRDEAEHKTKTLTFCKEGCKASYGKLESVMEKSGGPFLMGEEISAPDFHLWEMIDQLELMAPTVGAPSPVADFPKLAAFYAHVRALPKLEKYFASDMYKLPVNNKLASCYFK